MLYRHRLLKTLFWLSLKAINCLFVLEGKASMATTLPWAAHLIKPNQNKKNF